VTLQSPPVLPLRVSLLAPGCFCRSTAATPLPAAHLLLLLHLLLLQEENTIRVWNNGDGIPVEMHKEEGVYVPELIFGHLLTSSNYNDHEKKVRAGGSLCKWGCERCMLRFILVGASQLQVLMFI